LQRYANGEQDFRGADLRGANLSGADLREADLDGAVLSRAVLSRAVLSGADLSGAYLSGADLGGANLNEAGLSRADLSGAILNGADLYGADLYGAILNGADLYGAKLPDFQIPQGTLIVWKKTGSRHLVKLEISAEAQRTATPVGRKCRAEFARVLSVEGPDGVAVSHGLEYRVGELVYPDSYDPDIRVECTHGIHFFLTREEAKAW